MSIKKPVVGEDNITDCAVFDPIEGQWRFVAFSELQEQEFVG